MSEVKKVNESEEEVGIILSDSSTLACKMQILEEREKGNLREGMFLIIKTIKNRTILSRLV